MKTDAEAADLAEVITNYTRPKQYINAALSAGSEIIQTSLLDFLH
jgi:flagellin-like hook-associated protein FlgL